METFFKTGRKVIKTPKKSFKIFVQEYTNKKNIITHIIKFKQAK